jgi:hypothetical protein
MLITPRDIEVFKALNRYRWLRANFIHRLAGGSKQHVQRRLGWLRKEGYLGCPEQQKQSWSARCAPRVYELTQKSKALLQQNSIPVIHWQGERHFFHQLMVSDIVSSFEISARYAGLPFKIKSEIIGERPLSLPTSISYTFPWGKTETCTKSIEPDALFSVGNAHFLLEADRSTETIKPSNLRQSSFLRKLLQYKDVFDTRRYQTEWGLPSVLVLNVFTSKEHCENVKACRAELGGKPRSQLFKAIPILGSWEKHPEPLVNLLDDAWERVGHKPLVIRPA